MCFKSDSCLYPPLAKQLLYSSTILQGWYSQNSGLITWQKIRFEHLLRLLQSYLDPRSEERLGGRCLPPACAITSTNFRPWFSQRSSRTSWTATWRVTCPESIRVGSSGGAWLTWNFPWTRPPSICAWKPPGRTELSLISWEDTLSSVT